MTTLREYIDWSEDRDKKLLQFYFCVAIPGYLLWTWFTGGFEWALGLVIYGAIPISFMMGSGALLICMYMASHRAGCGIRQGLQILAFVPGFASVYLVKTEFGWLGGWASVPSLANPGIVMGVIAGVILGGWAIYFIRYGQLPNGARPAPNRLVALYWRLTRPPMERWAERRAGSTTWCDCPEGNVITDHKTMERVENASHIFTINEAEDNNVESVIEKRRRPEPRIREQPRYREMAETIGEEDAFRLFEQYRRGWLYYCPVKKCLWKVYIPDDHPDFTNMRMETITLRQAQQDFAPYW